jgi:tetratricopeptide (TPR) repeat protein
MGKRRRQTHQLAGDQFGEYEESRDEFGAGGGGNKAGAGRGGGGGGGGGTAGGSGPRGAVALAPREVPKFLQAYAHLLPTGGAGAGARGEDDPLVVGGENGDNSNQKRARRPSADDDDDDSQDDDPVQAEAIARALEDNPELAAEIEGKAGSSGQEETPAARQLRRARAAAEKERGNDAFKDGRHAEAARHFSRAIELDPSDAVFWSNRAAARAALGEHEGALVDARKAAELKPGWHKAHARVGAALEALSCPDEAEEAYRRALDLEPADAGLRQSVERAAAAARKLRREGKHVFKGKGGGGGGVGGGGAGAGGGGGAVAAAKPAAAIPTAPAPPPIAAAGVKAKGLLSFGDEDDEEE